jgi:hypothetical protein
VKNAGLTADPEKPGLNAEADAKVTARIAAVNFMVMDGSLWLDFYDVL